MTHLSYRESINTHYGRPDLTARILDHLQRQGIEPEHLRWEDLIDFDQYHGGGMKSTLWLAEATGLGPGMRVLDVGAGIGGTARVWCTKFGCTVFGIEPAEEFCNAAERLTSLVGMSDQIRFICDDVAEVELPDNSFDVAMFVNTLMNIEDEAGIFRKVYRSLKPGGRLAITARTATPLTDEGFLYPCPWASDPSTNFLSTPESTHADLMAAGFSDVVWEATPGEKSNETPLPPTGPAPFGLIMNIDVVAMRRNNQLNTSAGRVGSLRAVVCKRD